MEPILLGADHQVVDGPTSTFCGEPQQLTIVHEAPLLGHRDDADHHHQVFDDPTELGVEASRVQWATTDLELRTRPFPDDVKLALLGLLAARAQHLRNRLDVDVGARRSLERLQRQNALRGIATAARVNVRGTCKPRSVFWQAMIASRSSSLSPSRIVKSNA